MEGHDAAALVADDMGTELESTDGFTRHESTDGSTCQELTDGFTRQKSTDGFARQDSPSILIEDSLPSSPMALDASLGDNLSTGISTLTEVRHEISFIVLVDRLFNYKTCVNLLVVFTTDSSP